MNCKPNHKFSINKNIFNQSSGTTGNAGIRLQNTSYNAATQNTTTVKLNTLVSIKGPGIYLVNYGAALIGGPTTATDENHIVLLYNASSVSYGVRLLGCSNNTIQGNKIETASTPNSTYDTHVLGISVENPVGVANTLNSNRVKYLGTGIFFTNSTTAQKVECNEIDQNYIGVIKHG